ncbi:MULTISPECIES: YgeY family selenium metabolism-linked hydrolase [Clostridium]|uniref:YgeY family selenium metabolism-linked hydrolase n=1 Tax=Clostridium TaxID=1485 RepID=UPI0008A11077|nr:MULTISPECIES: YgeY family selenium metabolism-linked hydrolase [Clostridium]MDU1230735.1 YgeY family selenium metabolism-linked hydrolase [Clostridium sp.]OFS22154.1 selenium metabolism hydrolase [Clostridium sp. HMSC19A10]
MENNKKEELIKLCQDVIKIQSYSGNEGKLVEFLEKKMRECGFDDVIVDKYGSIIGKIKGKRPGNKVLFDAHIDTVPAEDSEKWSHDPFGGVIEDGRIYGRGTSDMKGALSAMIIAAKYFAKDNNKDFPGEIYISGVVHEECFEGVASRNISEYVKPDYVVIGEASHLNLKIGQRGRAEVVVETFGVPAHSANPEKGVNAVYSMAEIINKLQEIPYEEDEFLGKGILELTDIKSSPYPGASVVPSYCKATYDRRLLVGETKESVLKPIVELIEELKKNKPNVDYKVSYARGKEKCHTGAIIEGERFFPAWCYDQNEVFIKNTYEKLKSIGIMSKITNYSFCTNGSHYAGEAGIKTIGFGPSKENIAHTIDEYIEIDQLEKACKGYYVIMNSLLELI